MVRNFVMFPAFRLLVHAFINILSISEDLFLPIILVGSAINGWKKWEYIISIKLFISVIFMIQQIIIKITTYNFCFVLSLIFLMVPSNFILKMSFKFFLGCLVNTNYSIRFFFKISIQQLWNLLSSSWCARSRSLLDLDFSPFLT